MLNDVFIYFTTLFIESFTKQSTSTKSALFVNYPIGINEKLHNTAELEVKLMKVLPFLCLSTGILPSEESSKLKHA